MLYWANVNLNTPDINECALKWLSFSTVLDSERMLIYSRRIVQRRHYDSTRLRFHSSNVVLQPSNLHNHNSVRLRLWSLKLKLKLCPVGHRVRRPETFDGIYTPLGSSIFACGLTFPPCYSLPGLHCIRVVDDRGSLITEPVTMFEPHSKQYCSKSKVYGEQFSYKNIKVRLRFQKVATFIVVTRKSDSVSPTSFSNGRCSPLLNNPLCIAVSNHNPTPYTRFSISFEAIKPRCQLRVQSQTVIDTGRNVQPERHQEWHIQEANTSASVATKCNGTQSSD
jgi:hypothetical protein